MSMTAAASPALRLHPDDNVAVATRGIAAGATIDSGTGETIAVRERIEMGHKVALARIAQGSPVKKFGQTIGYATETIEPGQWLHTQNVEAGSLSLDYAFASEIPPEPAPIHGRTFMGYRRADGRAATRNYIAVISTVNCSAATSRFVAQRFDRQLLADFPNIDGIVPLVHKAGCAMQYGGPDHAQLSRVLAGFAKHANIAAYLLIGLGCETGQPSFLVDNYGLTQLQLPGSNADNSKGDNSKGGGQPAKRSPRLVLSIQDEGGVRKTVDRAVGTIREMLPEVNRVERVSIPASEIVLGTNCGGSDGSSGVTANPALGYASDLLVACGGTSILAETPEIYGGEHLLTRRAVSPEVGQRLVAMIKWWEEYTRFFGAEINNNPSVGNKKGGLTTIYEKSLGAIAKGGTTALRGVFRYADPVTEKGFVFMDTPGFDPASVTGLVAGGANVVVFTTGRGSCLGCKPVPSIKVATNTPLYKRMIDDMDLNAGRVVEGSSVEEVGREIFEKILAVASGEKTKSELQGIGDDEFCPWSIGPML